MYALSLCHGCRHYRLAIVVLLGGSGTWVEDECEASMPGAGGRLSCERFESRWRGAVRGKREHHHIDGGLAGARAPEGVDEGGAAADQ